jgi:hypothetical protein
MDVPLNPIICNFAGRTDVALSFVVFTLLTLDIH